MKQNRKRFAIYMVWLVLFGMIAEGCHGSRKCGCGKDLNAIYKPRRRHSL